MWNSISAVEDRAVSLCIEERARHREAAGTEHREKHNAYHDVLNNCGYDYEHDLCGAAEAGCALSVAFMGRGMETAVLRGGQD
jgi:hypothetical protein